MEDLWSRRFGIKRVEKKMQRINRRENPIVFSIIFHLSTKTITILLTYKKVIYILSIYLFL